MGQVRRVPLWPYIVAVLTVAAALFLTRLLTPLNEHTPLALFFAAVAFSAWYGGLGPGVVATVVGTLMLSSFVLPPASSLTIDSWDDVAILGVFALVALLISSLHAARRRAEVSQREQREWFEVTLASIGDAVIATDAQGRVTFINAVAESLTGWASAEAVGKDLSEVFQIIDMDTRQAVENPVAKVIRIGSVVGLANHTVLIAKDGTGRPIDDSGAPIRSRDGRLIGVVLVFRDVTERKQAEEGLQHAHDELEQRVQERTTELQHAISALRAEVAERARAVAEVRESEERYRQMFERNHAVKLLIDPDSGAIVDANPAAAEFYGYSLEELRRLRITDLNTLPSTQVAAEMARALVEQRTYFLFRHRLALGAIRDVEVYSGPVDLHGRRLLYSIIHDITQRRQAEEALQQAKDDLEHKVAERTAELHALNVQLQSSLSEKEVLLREIHHRVKNNMQLISSLLSLQADLIDDPRLLAMFTDSQQRIQSMALVHDILYRSDDLARINLADYIRLLITELRLSYRVDPGLINVQVRLDEVFVGIDTVIPCGLLLHELMSNCFKHAFAAGTTGEIRVELQSQPTGVLALVVSDNGCGFPEKLDFRRTDSLGLQLVCSLTEQLGGNIALERGHGTRFTITLPA
jgi:PAS domain S-box-containing protein